MTWLFWLLLSNGAIFVIEYIYRSAAFSSFVSALPFIIVPILIGQAGLFYGFRVGGANTLLYAGIAFTVINQILRIGNSLLLGEKIGLNLLAAVGLMLLAAWVGR